MTGAPTLHEQANEAQLHYLGLKNLVAQAEAGKIKRPSHEIDRMRQRRDIAEHAAATLQAVADRREARDAEARP